MLYVTSPRQDVEKDSFVYQSEQGEFAESRHIELKRDLRDNSQEDGPRSSQSVFEKYQFLSSGTFTFYLFTFLSLTMGRHFYGSLCVSYLSGDFVCWTFRTAQSGSAICCI